MRSGPLPLGHGSAHGELRCAPAAGAATPHRFAVGPDPDV